MVTGDGVRGCGHGMVREVWSLIFVSCSIVSYGNVGRWGDDEMGVG